MNIDTLSSCDGYIDRRTFLLNNEISSTGEKKNLSRAIISVFMMQTVS